MSQDSLLLGTKIRQICADRGISVRQVERDSGLSERTINRWDTNSPSIDKVIAVANTLGLTVDELISGTKNPATKSDGIGQEALAAFIASIPKMSEEQVDLLQLIAKKYKTDQ